MPFQSTLPARGATRALVDDASIIQISIHAPRTGSDVGSHSAAYSANVFQSTLPARGATSAESVTRRRSRNFNPRSPHGERPLRGIAVAPRSQFQSTLPARGATIVTPAAAAQYQFQSTLPARGATIDALTAQRIEAFQSTLPARGATCHLLPRGIPIIRISIHAPRTGSDLIPTSEGEAFLISIHAPRTGSDKSYSLFFSFRIFISIHAPRTGSDNSCNFSLRER